MKVELKSLKVHKDMSEETTCFSATIYIDGIKAGDARNSGHGGMTMVHIFDPDLRKKLAAFVDTLPTEKSQYFPEGLKLEVDSYIDTLVEQAEELKWLKRNCKGKTMFRTSDQKSGEWFTIKSPFSPAVKDHLVKKYGDKLVEIANEKLTS